MKLEGLVVNFLGDSITEGSGETNVAENRYDNVLKREYRLAAVNNYGIGGYETSPSRGKADRTVGQTMIDVAKELLAK